MKKARMGKIFLVRPGAAGVGFLYSGGRVECGSDAARQTTARKYVDGR